MCSSSASRTGSAREAAAPQGASRHEENEQAASVAPPDLTTKLNNIGKGRRRRRRRLARVAMTPSHSTPAAPAVPARRRSPPARRRPRRRALPLLLRPQSSRRPQHPALPLNPSNRILAFSAPLRPRLCQRRSSYPRCRRPFAPQWRSSLGRRRRTRRFVPSTGLRDAEQQLEAVVAFSVTGWSAPWWSLLPRARQRAVPARAMVMVRMKAS